MTTSRRIGFCDHDGMVPSIVELPLVPPCRDALVLQAGRTKAVS